MQRVVAHVDMDAFYVSVSVLLLLTLSAMCRLPNLSQVVRRSTHWLHASVGSIR